MLHEKIIQLYKLYKKDFKKDWLFGKYLPLLFVERWTFYSW